MGINYKWDPALTWLLFQSKYTYWTKRGVELSDVVRWPWGHHLMLETTLAFLHTKRQGMLLRLQSLSTEWVIEKQWPRNMVWVKELHVFYRLKCRRKERRETKASFCKFSPNSLWSRRFLDKMKYTLGRHLGFSPKWADCLQLAWPSVPWANYLRVFPCTSC